MTKRLIVPQHYNGISRRKFLNNAGLALSAAAAGQTLFPRGARAAGAASGSDNVIRVLGVVTAAPKSWEAFEKATGFTVEWTPIADDAGIFLHEMMANDAGERYDIVTCFSGTYEILADQGLLMPIETAKLSNWGGLPEPIKRATQMKDAGNAWSIPVLLNADSFAYSYTDLGEPEPPNEVSWKILYDDQRTMGKVAIDNGIFAITCCAIYLKYHGLVEISDIANMTRSECNSVADYLIERKKAGQFRTLYKSYDEQVQLLANREVLAETCWEPAALDAKSKGLDVAYAYAIEGYDKWSQNLMVPAQVTDRGGSEKTYALIDYFMGGAYAAEKSASEGYVTPRPDLGLAFAEGNGWSVEEIDAIRVSIEKVDKKFIKDLFWNPGYFNNLEYYENAMAKFKNA